jgi:hemerythrin-like domain-containing protein
MTERKDGIGFLLEQHERVTELLEAVQRGPGDGRQRIFDELRELLAVHETAEELILRPATRKSVPGGDAIADARIAEENQSKDVLAKLERLDVTSEEFVASFAAFADDVRQHAHNEETHEFPLLEQHQEESALQRMRDQLEMAEKLAPTHPHPSARSTAANLVLGPFAAMVDRVRDALRSVTS